MEHAERQQVQALWPEAVDGGNDAGVIVGAAPSVPTLLHFSRQGHKFSNIRYM